jgi:hypothetical protein
MNDDNWEIWNAPTSRKVSDICLIAGGILFAVLRIWIISIPTLIFIALVIWQFFKAGNQYG